MDPFYPAISDSIILSHLRDDEVGGWRLLIDKYAPMMYGSIYKLTGDLTITAKILETVFAEINKPEMIKQMELSPAIYLFHLSQAFALNELKVEGLQPIQNTNSLFKDYPLLNLLFCDRMPLNEALNKLGISLSEAKIQLRRESNQLRVSTALKNL